MLMSTFFFFGDCVYYISVFIQCLYADTICFLCPFPTTTSYSSPASPSIFFLFFVIMLTKSVYHLVLSVSVSVSVSVRLYLRNLSSFPYDLFSPHLVQIKSHFKLRVGPFLNHFVFLSSRRSSPIVFFFFFC